MTTDEATLPDTVIRRIQAHAAAGAAFLDHVMPSWNRRVDPDRLRMDSSVACILGQTHTWFFRGRDALSLSQTQAESLGFVILEEVTDFAKNEIMKQGHLPSSILDTVLYFYLNEAWRNELARRN